MLNLKFVNLLALDCGLNNTIYDTVNFNNTDEFWIRKDDFLYDYSFTFNLHNSMVSKKEEIGNV